MIQRKGPGLRERKERKRISVALKLVAENVVWQLALPQTGVQCSSALKGSVKGEPRKNSRLLAEGTAPDQERRKTSKCKIPQSILPPIRCGKAGLLTVETTGGRGTAAPTCPQGTGRLRCLRTTALEPTLENLCDTLPLTSPAPSTCFTQSL